MSETKNTPVKGEEKLSPSIPHNSPTPFNYTYALLMETSEEEHESWYNFIRYQGNEKELHNLQDQLSKVDWYIVDGLSTFDLELDYLVSEHTAKEMTKVDLNHTSHHRKFDGKMKNIDLKLKQRYSNEKMMKKIFDILGYGQIDEYVDNEDIDPEDLTDCSSDTEDSSSSDTEQVDDQSSSSESESTDKKKNSHKKLGKLPASLLSKPRIARARQGRRKK